MLGFLKKTSFWVIALVLVGVGYLGYTRFTPAPPTFTTTNVVKKAIAEYVTATGSVAAPAKYTLAFEHQGVVREIPVKVGDAVKAGDALVVLDDAEAKNLLARAKANEAAAYARLKQVTDGTRAEEIYLAETAFRAREQELARVKSLADANVSTSASDLASATQRVASATEDLEKTQAKADSDLQYDYANGLTVLRANIGKVKQALAVIDRVRRLYFESRDTITFGTKILEIQRQAEAATSVFGAKLDTAIDQASIDATFDAASIAIEKTHDTLQYIRNVAIEDVMIRDTFPTTERTNIEVERASIEAVDTAVTTAKENIQNQKSTNAVTVANAATALRDAKSALATATQKQSGATVGGLSDVTRAESSVAEAKAQLNLKRAGARSSDVNLALAELDSAKSSVADAEVNLAKMVLRAPADGIITDVAVDRGEVVSMGTNINPVVTMIAARPYEIEANVAEIDIPKLKVQNPIEITFDAYPDRNFTGHVTEIYPAEIVVQGVIYYRIKANFEDPEMNVKPGMTANLKMVTASKESALVVPYAALTREGKKEFVRIPVGQTFETREVQIGIQGETEVEVVEGLKEGDKVITFIKQQ